MPRITLQPISAEAFAPFGQLLPAAAIGAPRPTLIEELINSRPNARARLNRSAFAPTPLPLTALRVERHLYSAQAFIPCGALRYLVLVVPPRASDGMPDAARALAFAVPGTMGINYAPGVWHHPMTALDGPAEFVTLTFVDGTDGDEEFVTLDEAVVIDE
ncbi:MAG TPA: ureidoglycolate lyase [Kaistia sp.]|nr:ureidoglycolate lyase [Kaistia sp.]